MRLVLLALLDRALVPVEVGICRETLARLGGKVAVGHRVADRDDAQAEPGEHPGQVAGGLALADAGAHGGHGDHGSRAAQHRAARAVEPEVGARRDAARGDVHDLLVAHVRVGEDDDVDAFPLEQVAQL